MPAHSSISILLHFALWNKRCTMNELKQGEGDQNAYDRET